MKDFFNKFLRKEPAASKITTDDQLKRQVAAIYGLLSGILGSEKVVLKAGKLDALELMRSESVPERVLALQKLVFEDPTVDKVPTYEEIPAILEDIEEELADLMARRAVEEKIKNMLEKSRCKSSKMNKAWKVRKR